jgi:hypothetical protein
MHFCYNGMLSPGFLLCNILGMTIGFRLCFCAEIAEIKVFARDTEATLGQYESSRRSAFFRLLVELQNALPKFGDSYFHRLSMDAFFFLFILILR